MKLTKSQVCVYISDEAQLEEARELLEKYGEKENKNSESMLYENGYYPYLMITWDNDGWYLSPMYYTKVIITLQELETILNEVK